MKKSILYSLSLLVVALAFFACETQTTPEPLRTQYPDQQSPITRDDAYYSRLRAYKKTKHPLAFGWYGSWTVIAPSAQCRLASAPDSMDIISMWSQWHSLTDQQIADKAFVQQTKGTRVVICISARDVPAEFKEGGTSDGEITDESLVAYAKAWAKDSMDKYQYDGIDIDFETAVDHQGPLNTKPGLFEKFCVELSKYIGPKSGTGRLFLIDGNIDAYSLSPNKIVAELCDYAVAQAYNCSGSSDLQRRTSSAASMGWKAEQMIFTENFESKWQTGGVEYTNLAGEKLSSSLMGMAQYAAQGHSAGFGSYHMEYEYGFKDMPYKYMRRSIQLANPAPKGDYTKTLISINENQDEKFKVVSTPSGALVNTVETSVTARLSAIVSSEMNFDLKVDNSLVAKYNDYYYSDYKTLDPTKVQFSEPLHFASGSLESDNSTTISITDFAGVEAGEYLVPIRMNLAGKEQFSPNTDKEVKYLFITNSIETIKFSISGGESVTLSKLEAQGDSAIGTVSHTLSASTNLNVPADLAVKFVSDASLVAAYNKANNTNYAAVQDANVSVTGSLSIAKGSKNSTGTVTVSMTDFTKLPAVRSMIAVRPDLKSATDYSADEAAGVKYILIYKVAPNIEEGATTVAGTVISDMTGWNYTLEGYGTGAVGGDDPNTIMFDGDNAQMGWYTSLGGKRRVQIDMAKEQTLAGWRMGMVLGSPSYATLKLFDIETSTDGTTWDSQSVTESVAIGAADANKWQYVKFVTPVKCRYIRMNYNNASGSSSNSFIGSNEFNGIAPNN